MLYSIVGILVVIVDQLVKFWVQNHLFGDDIVRFIPHVVSLVNVHNYGAAFGFLDTAGARIWFIVATGVFVLLVILALATNFITGKLSRWSLVLVAAGGVGNMIDRVLYGYVQDMFKVELFNFAVFNVADMFITVFAILFALAMIFEKPDNDEDLEEFAEDDEDDEDEPAPKKEKPARKTLKKARRQDDEDEDDEDDEDDEPEPAPKKKVSAVKAARKARQDRYEQEYEEYKAQQRAAMKKKAETAPAPAPAESVPQSAAAPQTRPTPAEDPFAAWESANKRAEAARDDSYAGRVMNAPRTAPKAAPAEQPKPAPAPVQQPKPVAESAPAPQPKPAPAPQPASPAGEEFDLDDILAEFK